MRNIFRPCLGSKAALLLGNPKNEQLAALSFKAADKTQRQMATVPIGRGVAYGWRPEPSQDGRQTNVARTGGGLLGAEISPEEFKHDIAENAGNDSDHEV